MKICWMRSWFAPHRRATEYNRRQEQMQVIAHHWIARAFISRMNIFHCWQQEWTYFTVCIRSSKHWKKVKCLNTLHWSRTWHNLQKCAISNKGWIAAFLPIGSRHQDSLGKGWEAVYPKCFYKSQSSHGSVPVPFPTKVQILPANSSATISYLIHRTSNPRTTDDLWGVGRVVRNLRMDRNGYDVQYVTM